MSPQCPGGAEPVHRSLATLPFPVPIHLTSGSQTQLGHFLQIEMDQVSQIGAQGIEPLTTIDFQRKHRQGLKPRLWISFDPSVRD